MYLGKIDVSPGTRVEMRMLKSGLPGGRKFWKGHLHQYVLSENEEVLISLGFGKHIANDLTSEALSRILNSDNLVECSFYSKENNIVVVGEPSSFSLNDDIFLVQIRPVESKKIDSRRTERVPVFIESRIKFATGGGKILDGTILDASASGICISIFDLGKCAFDLKERAKMRIFASLDSGNVVLDGSIAWHKTENNKLFIGVSLSPLQDMQSLRRFTSYLRNSRKEENKETTSCPENDKTV